MPDRVKEAVFSILGSHYECPGALPPLRVADVFAGSGSMGLEALSRGAASCCFFECDPLALEVLRRNIRSLNVGPAATIITRDAWGAAVSTPDGGSFDLLLLDPPYADSHDMIENGKVRHYLERIARESPGRPLVVFHHQATAGAEPLSRNPWQVLDRREFGTHAITLLI